MDSESIVRLEREWLTKRVTTVWGARSTQVRDGALFLGCYAGVGDAVEARGGALAHEMAHLVEIDDRRATAENFGLRYKRTVTFPPSRYHHGIYPDPRTCQGVERECRVIAIQLRILASVGWTAEETTEDTLSTIRALDILPDWGYVPGKNKEARRAWCLRKVQQAQRHWTTERVRAEWWRKVVIVTKRLERREKRATSGASGR